MDDLESIEAMKEELKEVKQRLVDQFYLDNLTGLPNIYKLRSDLEEHQRFTLILYNIDNFKVINDYYGFIVGDNILESVANTLKTFFENSAFIYRVASDEFAILLDRKLNYYSLKDYMKELTSEVAHLTFTYSNSEIYVDATLASSFSISNEDIFSKVNIALKYAKSKNLNFWIYEDSMSIESEYGENLKFSTKVRKALYSSGLIPYFQPIIDNKTGKIVKYEALSRLIDEDWVVHSPLKFIPAAKNIKIYDLVTREIIAKTFDIFNDNDLEFSINLSFEDIINPDISLFIEDMLINSDVGGRLTFELLESEKVNDFDKVMSFFNKMKRYNVKLAIDDFGSGFSNFSYLTKLNPDYIKIDGSLIKELDSNENAQIVVKTIVNFAKELGIKTIAEYVHSSMILSAVKNMGIDYSQGYYIDEPSPKIVKK